MSVKSDRDWIDRGMTSLQEKSINKVARQTRKLKNEQYRIIDEQGNVVLTKKGDGHQGVHTVGESRRYLPDAVAIHNHPDGGTFSSSDLGAFGYGARAIVVSTPEGKYYLINKKRGTREAYSGWYSMQEALEKQRFNNRDIREFNNAVAKRPRVSRLMREINRIAERWVKARDSGKPKEVIDKIFSSYEKKRDIYDRVRKVEARKEEVEPYHRWYQENAAKYGFAYQFIKW